jgi:plasmid maintenance system killer protein
MILGFRDDWLREFFVNDVRSKKIPSDLEDRLFRKIQMIDDATTDRDFEIAAQQPLREAARPSRRPPLDPRQQALAAGVSMEQRPG